MSEIGERVDKNPITREEVIESFKNVSGKEFMDPEKLPTHNNPNFNTAREKLRAWIDGQDQLAINASPDVIAEIELNKATVLIDAGFRNKNYLVSVREWINEDMNSAENEGVSVNIIAEMQKRVDEIDKILNDKPLQQAA